VARAPLSAEELIVQEIEQMTVEEVEGALQRLRDQSREFTRMAF
jgi:hypothetical protein